MAKVRVLRLLEYYGDRDAIEAALNRRGVKGIWCIPNGPYEIREAMLGEFPIPLTADEPKES